MTRRSYFFLLSFCALFALGFTTARASHHRHSVNISDGHRQPATDCADLRIRFDDQDAAVRSEEHTLTRAEAGSLQVQPHTNGGLQVVGWDKDTYSVTACKAAAGPADEAERILSQITLSVQPGRVSTNGPGSEEDWTVYLLMRVPKAANLAMETMNGPLALYDVDGKVTAKTHNGPIRLRNFSGEAEISAVNGPISLEGGKGSVKIHTENGPINVELAGSAWTGAGLTADAHNGPVTLSVPSGFQSSFVVESTNHAPVSCKASICESARRTWDDEHRRIEYGNGPATIRLSTVNGPVSVRDSQGTM
jgi:putative adhesin